ncbi:SDR family oxidoreductase [Tautonia plasticadhaerens]|uniref:Rhamnolipids biosynthesis 3-oxoacyl-[acyl-carrier-protein] reductase n=1 Tax=Tautonia plasticadhaerens TaxID=2527974 RepID=A0A518H4I3_9BACT|nr:SDR family oxidoreductase [Tautonia plasticadhaerens]QDV35727.1 Rhamnolipids biosynthesis 3-oxoacyl-[acyl-carrier-protein] reductase [Tautonia plasticadhaerens]
MADLDGIMAGRRCLVTGATAGIGEVTARELAGLGASVVLVGRDAGKCEATAARIRDLTGNPAVESLVADLSSMAEVSRLADAFRRRHDRLDVLVANAGALFLKRSETVDGFERTFALNHLSPFLLTTLLLDPIRAASPSRIVVVASDAHRGMTLDFDDLQARRGRYWGMFAYGRSKLANILFARELARRLEGTGVTSNALHPGFVSSSFFSGPGPARWAMRRVASLFAIAPEQGAKTSVYLASSPEVSGVSGHYFARCKEATPSPAARDDEAARRLWQVSEGLLGAWASGPAE